MKRILWFSNCELTVGNISSTGTWLIAMMEALVETKQVELYNVTDGIVNEITQRDCKGVKQWVLPRIKTNKNGLPPSKIIYSIKSIVQEINPDLVHIWGTENYWGMLIAKGIIKKPVILDMQGVLKGITQVYFGGLTISEKLQCIGLKELLLPKAFLYFKKKKIERKARFEQEIIQSVQHISVQSEWVKAYVKDINPSSSIYDTGIILRKEFYEAKPWESLKGESPVLFTSSSGAASYKGLHVLFRAVAVLKKKYPHIRLKVAGKMQRPFPYRDGYTNWLCKEAKKLGIQDNIDWLGSLNANEIIGHFYTSSVVIIPSYVESYSLAFAEAMIVGVPTVVSFAGAMPELASHYESSLFFPPGDFMACAWNVEKLLSSPKFSEEISAKSRFLGFERNRTNKIIDNQLNIYEELASKSL